MILKGISEAMYPTSQVLKHKFVRLAESTPCPVQNKRVIMEL